MKSAMTDALKTMFREWSGAEGAVTPLPVSGSNRRYFRFAGSGVSAIGSYNPDKRENTAFLGFTSHFHSLNLPVPQIYRSDPSKGIILMQDLGDTTLFDLIQEHEGTIEAGSRLDVLLKESLKTLVRFQVVAGKTMDYSMCYPRSRFDRQSLIQDLNYFKYYFLKLLNITFDEQKLEDDFGVLSSYLLKAGAHYFMYRDFQSRNVMVLGDRVYFIDYQGGRKGPLQYDVASFLYQARAGFDVHTRDRLLACYLDELLRNVKVQRQVFLQYFNGFVLIRLLQTLGAYGFRGYYERKDHFIRSIPFAVANLEWLMNGHMPPVQMPELTDALAGIVAHFSDKAKPEKSDGLTIRIKSFSYKRGIPSDDTGNGGGFVFDCRFLPNPGREEKYRLMTGMDDPVVQYLKASPEVASFLADVCSIVFDAASNYIGRRFNHLAVNFGCTGGRHRSVYCAEYLCQQLFSRTDLKVTVEHTSLPKD